VHMPNVICGLPGSTIFFHIISKWHDFWGGVVTEHKMCYNFQFSLKLLSETFLILSITEQDMIM